MPITQGYRQTSISKDSIAGYDHRGATGGAYTGISELAGYVEKKNPTTWKQIFRILPRFISNVRQWVMNEQVTAVAGRQDLENDSNVATLAFNTDTYVNLTGAYTHGGGLYYPIYNGHFDHSGAYSIFTAQNAGDYLIHAYFYGETSDVAAEDYIEIFTSWRQNSGVSWVAPLILAGADNSSNNLTRVVSCNGMYVLRMERGNQLRFGIHQVGKSATWASFDRAEIRVCITKQKFYPILKS